MGNILNKKIQLKGESHMSKYLILYRHGMAEDKEKISDDDLRSLSLRGKKLLKKSVSGFKTMLGNHKSMQIYSSPTLRVRETAEMLSEELDLDDPIYLDFIGTGGSVRLLRDLVTDMEPEDVAIIVGQQPYLSLWSQELSGTFLRFKKGTAACFKLPNEGGEAKAELIWYLQAREFARIDD